jgi:hypothetical protein
VLVEPVTVAGVPAWVVPYEVVVPYWKNTVVSCEFALIKPLNTADVLLPMWLRLWWRKVHRPRVSETWWNGPVRFIAGSIYMPAHRYTGLYRLSWLVLSRFWMLWCMTYYYNRITTPGYLIVRDADVICGFCPAPRRRLKQKRMNLCVGVPGVVGAHITRRCRFRWCEKRNGS